MPAPYPFYIGLSRLSHYCRASSLRFVDEEVLTPEYVFSGFVINVQI